MTEKRNFTEEYNRLNRELQRIKIELSAKFSLDEYEEVVAHLMYSLDQACNLNDDGVLYNNALSSYEEAFCFLVGIGMAEWIRKDVSIRLLWDAKLKSREGGYKTEPTGEDEPICPRCGRGEKMELQWVCEMCGNRIHPTMIDKEKKCPDCEGVGLVYWDFDDPVTQSVQKAHAECPTCKGTGKIIWEGEEDV